MRGELVERNMTMLSLENAGELLTFVQECRDRRSIEM